MMAPAASAPVVADPGFEGAYLACSGNDGAVTGAIAPGWSDNSDWAPVSVAYSADAASPHGGAHSQKVEILSAPSGAVQLVPPLRLTPQRVYEFSVGLRGQSPTSVRTRAFGRRDDAMATVALREYPGARRRLRNVRRPDARRETSCR